MMVPIWVIKTGVVIINLAIICGAVMIASMKGKKDDKDRGDGP